MDARRLPHPRRPQGPPGQGPGASGRGLRDRGGARSRPRASPRRSSWPATSSPRRVAWWRTWSRPRPAPPSVAAVRDFLKAAAPRVVDARRLLVLDRCRLTSSGKIDRRCSPAPKLGRVWTARGRWSRPRTELEERLVAIWEDTDGVSSDRGRRRLLRGRGQLAAGRRGCSRRSTSSSAGTCRWKRS